MTSSKLQISHPWLVPINLVTMAICPVPIASASTLRATSGKQRQARKSSSFLRLGGVGGERRPSRILANNLLRAELKRKRSTDYLLDDTEFSLDDSSSLSSIESKSNSRKKPTTAYDSRSISASGSEVIRRWKASTICQLPTGDCSYYELWIKLQKSFQSYSLDHETKL